MTGTVLFLDGQRGSFVIYQTDDGDLSFRHYVYRQVGSQVVRVYVKRGESVDWIECPE